MRLKSSTQLSTSNQSLKDKPKEKVNLFQNKSP